MNEENGNGQAPRGPGVPTTAVVEQLLNRISSLTMELAMKDAYIAQLEEKAEHPLVPVEAEAQ